MGRRGGEPLDSKQTHLSFFYFPLQLSFDTRSFLRILPIGIFIVMHPGLSLIEPQDVYNFHSMIAPEISVLNLRRHSPLHITIR